MPKRDTKLLTVVIPAWNLGPTLRESVRSVKAQRISADIIIVDNRSDRPLPKIGGTRVIRLRRRVTVGEARNAGFRHVRTPFVCFVDGDDRLVTGSLRRLLRAVEDDRVVMAVGRELLWDPRTGRTRRSDWPFSYAYPLAKHQGLFAIANAVRNILPSVGYAVLRTDAVKRSGGFPPMNYAEDWCFGVGLAFQGRVRMLKHPTRLYRLSGEQTRLSRLAKGRWGPRLRAQREVRRRLRRLPVVPTWAKLVSPLLSVPHLFLSLRDVLRTRRS